jgi:hypothetical protein
MTSYSRQLDREKLSTIAPKKAIGALKFGTKKKTLPKQKRKSWKKWMDWLGPAWQAHASPRPSP